MSKNLTTFDVAHYLDSKEMIAEYLSQVLSDGDMNELLAAIGNIAKAKGMTQIAKDTGLGRESLYKTFAEGSQPKFETIMKVLNSFGVKLQATA
ncbi:MAG: putative addiction module antidote protein [Sulfurimonas sp. RIFCSPHIGHO2_12_FULL_36_9]|uniref:addiction module antidote protein n=1 Tax=Sulfurimonas sp. RIFCSPLOWO2_12_36_12 TaxID=1802253 RepID=UPI0008D41918|nr:addiction module antidote protein [Sulfurimonas sp. RIFCSPLOWO2_12_36_12]OHD96610.1 MAG: putative addiction module antidote protein [Sulfurimonas sp. RIFCSPHIGHO2_12_FULL_36_9]OHD99316.1 MAG: putative addiction module antidote protein [Sulfurimonas sp. RIFCSPLOWO2_02_FULL_36_28]OHE01259.1 MAG: putative addiction module antidote protein [Sulfurimonas sp. RIFCSPLOWO2_12_36_12]OHE04989.1 MAG: putative addiction module antidote protein [Sulfurimonas sp. RIFCSPLOWO2_12_FULL_36_74]